MVDTGYRVGARSEDLQLDPFDWGLDLASPGVNLVDELDRVHVEARADHRRDAGEPQFNEVTTPKKPGPDPRAAQ